MSARKAIAAIWIAALLTGCAVSIPDFSFSDDQEDIENGLTKEQRERRDRLVAGKSTRPSLSSLDLEPQREDLPVADSGVSPPSNDIPELTLQQKRDEYEALLPLIDDPTLKEQIAFRLADIKILLAEQSLESASDDQFASLYKAIQSYRNVISTAAIIYPDGEAELSDTQLTHNAKIMEAMYQLSRALDLSGQREESVDVANQFLTSFNLDQFPVSEKHIELWFRIGEHHFSQGSFPNAIQYYQEVLSRGKAYSSSDFYGISAYMLGWSYFKLDDYDNALSGFDKMLAHVTQPLEEVESKQVDALELSRGNLRLVKDVLRIMALTFSYRGDEIAISKFYNAPVSENPGNQSRLKAGALSYLHLIYEELAQQHLDDSRYQDSADVLLSFAQAYPLHERSVEFFIRHIDAYILGGFPDRVLAGKQAFVAQYSLQNDIVDSFYTAIGRKVSVYLQKYLPELAQTEHSIAQSIETIISIRLNESSDVGFTSAFNQSSLTQEQLMQFRDIDIDKLNTLKNEAYENAIEYYTDFINSFSFDIALAEQVAELQFYKAEALYGSGQYQRAVDAFETYAYDNQINPRSVEAAYAAILAWQKRLQSSPNVSDELTLAYQQSQKKFLDIFPNDTRSPAIAITLMQALFKQQDYVAAMRWSSWILEDARDIHQFTYEQTESALLVSAHGNFALSNYVQAEQAYDVLLSTLPDGDSRRAELNESLATSIYKQAETALSEQNLNQEVLAQIDLTNASLDKLQQEALTQAIDHFSRLITKTPDASSRVIAEYDIATYHALLGDWQKAIAGWLTFEKRYPQHELAANIRPQLLFAYQQTEDWLSSAQLLLDKYELSPDSKQGRVALYTAAEYFDKANDRPRALDTYRSYAHAFEQPLAQANEARYRLSQFYLESDESSKRRFWLNKMMQAQLALSPKDPSSAGTPRSRYLAAMSAMVFAKDADYVYSRVRLTAPIDKSLRKKQQALENAIKAYDRVMSFAVAEYTTAANYSLANLYAGLANDLMDSERPSGLNELELAQYDMLLEEQAYPFEETAIQIHEQNISRVQQGLYDEYIKQSFDALSRFMPARYNKPEINPEVTKYDL